MLCLDVDMGCQRQVMRNLRAGLVDNGRWIYVYLNLLTPSVYLRVMINFS